MTVARQRTSLTLALVAVVAIAGGACGGSEGEGPDNGSTAPSHAEFVQRANATCRKQRRGIKSKTSVYLKQHKDEPAPLRYAGLAHFVLLPTIELELKEIRAIPAPLGESAHLQRLLFSERRTIDELAIAKKIASMATFRRHFANSERLFRRWGLTSCLNGPRSTAATAAADSE